MTKAYVVYKSSGWDTDFHAMLIKEDGKCIADHLCSHQLYMLGDLWTSRKELREKNPDIQVNDKIYSIVDFKSDHPDIFAKAFVETKEEEESK